jgi:hypothetical protein
MIIQVSSLERSKRTTPFESSSLIDVVAVHADRLDETLPAPGRASLLAA